MVENLYQRHNAGLHPDPKIGRYFLFSLVLHLAVVLVFSGVFISRPVREHRPVYYVDLSQLPVANPRAGRPDGSLQAGSKAAAPKPAKAAAPAPAKAAAPAPKPAKPKKSASVKPSASKPEPVKKADSAAATRSKKAASGKVAAEKRYQETLKAMEAMREKARRQQEIDALKEKIADLGASDTRAGVGGGSGTGAGAVPLGMPDGKGTEAGVGHELWLQTWLKENWSFSRYQASRRDLVATTRITYDAEGSLIGYQFLKKSGDSNFDDSVTKAILKGRQLAFKPGRRFEVDVEFNLKDLKE
jgi:colicin import membrane protein